MAVFGGDEDEAVGALEFEPANVLDSGAVWVGIVLDVVGNGLRFGIDGVRAVVGEVTVEGGGLLFLGAGCAAVGEGFAFAFDGDLDAHPAGAVVHDEAGGMIVGDVANGRVALDRDQAPCAEEFAGDIVLLGTGGDGEAEEEREEDAEGFHGGQV